MSTTPRRLSTFLMPRQVTGWVRAMAWASLIANALLIVTGGAVRLTASGLGCPTWPRCTAQSWTNTPEMGLHGYIEFGNRTLTFVLVVVAVLTFLSVIRLRRDHPLLTWLAFAMGLGIPLQAVIGGITVRTGLNPWIVGIHFILSAALIAMGAVLVDHVRRIALPHVAEAERGGQIVGAERTQARALAWIIGLSAALTLYLGTLVTGTGPHSGDAGEVARHTFNPIVITRMHAAPVYLLVAVTLVALALSFKRRWPAPVRRMLVLLTGILILQAAIGYYQYLNGVPELAVWFHMGGAALLTAVVAMTVEKIHAVSAEPGARPAHGAPADEHAVA